MEEILKSLDEKMGNMEKWNLRIEQKLDNYQLELKSLKLENMEIKRTNMEMQKEIDDQNKRINELEKELRKKNIIIYGIEEAKEEDVQCLKQKVKEIITKLEVQCNENEDILDIRRIGKVDTNKIRPLLVETKNWNKKIEIMKATSKLKGTKIFLSDDYPKDIQNQRKILIQHMKEAKDQGHRVKLNYNTLIIDGRIYTAENIGQRQELGEASNSVNLQQKGKARTLSQRSPDEKSDEMARTNKIIKIYPNTGAISKNIAFM